MMNQDAPSWIEAMAKHLPPSASTLRLLDIGGSSGSILRLLRPDVAPEPAAVEAVDWKTEADTIDAVTLLGTPSAAVLAAALHVLRPGGRFIAVDPAGQADADWVKQLETSGFTRILVEPALDLPAPQGVLLRGEKPHTTADTLARVRVAAQQDDRFTSLDRYPGRFIFLLIRQVPHKPVWMLKEDEKIEWFATALVINQVTALLAFSSLAKAVAFMQPAVLDGHLRDVHKVVKFSVQTARSWVQPLLLNPANTVLVDYPKESVFIDPTTAERSDE